MEHASQSSSALWQLGPPLMLVIGYVLFLIGGGSGNTSIDTIIHLLMFVVVVVLLYLYNIDDRIEGHQEKTNTARQNFFKKLKQEITTFHLETNQVDYYSTGIANKSVHFKFLDKHPNLLDVLKDIHFLIDWDRAGYTNLVILLERFMQQYYRLIKNNNEDDTRRMLPILKDLKHEILNVFHTFVYSVPLLFKKPKYEHLNTTDEFLAKRGAYIKTFLFKKMRVLTRQIDDVRIPYEVRPRAPWAGNEFRDSSYEIF
jgi:hypothetical protein